MFGWLARKLRSFLSAKSAVLAPQTQQPSLTMSFWVETTGGELAQGDYLSNCLVPSFAPSFGGAADTADVPVEFANLIIVTQICDLVNAKVGFAALCKISTLAEFEEVNPKFKQKGRWEEVRKGRVEGC